MGSAGYWGLRHEEDPVLVKESASRSAPRKDKTKKKRINPKRTCKEKRRKSS